MATVRTSIKEKKVVSRRIPDKGIVVDLRVDRITVRACRRHRGVSLTWEQFARFALSLSSFELTESERERPLDALNKLQKERRSR